LPSSLQLQTSTSSYGGSKDESLVAALEKAKVQVQQMVKKRSQEQANIDSEPLYPTYKKSRVVPKSSTGVLTENRRLEGDNAEIDSKKKTDSSAADLDDGSHRVGTNAEGVVSMAESQKNDTEQVETSKAKKSLPFIGKLPFLKAARTAKQAANEQSAADDKSKIEIKLNVSHTMSPPVESEPTLLSSNVVTTLAQEQAVPKWSVSVPRSNVESSSTVEPNSLDAFLSIGDPESEQSRAVPVLSVGPQTRSEFMLENQPSGTKKSPEVTEASNTLPPASKDKDVVTVPSQSKDVKAAVTDGVTEGVELNGTIPTSNSSNKSQSHDVSLCVTNTSVVQTRDNRTVSVSDPPDANSTGILAVADTECNTDQSPTIKDEDDSALYIEIDENTEDYEPEDNAKSEQVAQLPRDEEIARLLPQTSAIWMQPAASGCPPFCTSACSQNNDKLHTTTKFHHLRF